MRKVLLIVGVLFLSACDDPNATTKVLEANGFTNIETKGYGFWNCGHGDFYSTKFVATSPNQVRISGTVCKGLFKGSTIRFD